MLKLKFLLLSLLLINAAFAQNKLNRKADSLYQAKNYTQAGRYYVATAKSYGFKALQKGALYNAACSYALAGETDSAMIVLKQAVANGYKNTAHLKTDSDLNTLHNRADWLALITLLENMPAENADPYKAKLVTTDVKNFWKAYDLAQKDTTHRLDIYKKYYIDAGTDGLQDYFAYKINNMPFFVKAHDEKPEFYKAIRKNTYTVDQQKAQMQNGFVKMKELYPAALFPNIYFVIGAFSSGGTSSDNGLLIGLDQAVRSPDIPVDELSLWQRNNFTYLKDLPNLIAHELVHYNQKNMAQDTTLLRAVLVEGMADFIGELTSGRTANDRLHVWAKGKEKQIWADFEKEMYLKRAYNWIANSNQETVDHPADLGYWVGYQICKAYYNKSADKKKAVEDMLNIKDYKGFYDKSGVHSLFN
jgi:hypothetical protein